MDQNTAITEGDKTEPFTAAATLNGHSAVEPVSKQKSPPKGVAMSPKRKTQQHHKAKRPARRDADSGDSDESSQLSSASDDSSGSSSDTSFDLKTKKKLKARKYKAEAKAKAKQSKMARKARKEALALQEALDDTEDDSDDLRKANLKLAKTKKILKQLQNAQDSDTVEIQEDPHSARLRALKASLQSLNYAAQPVVQPNWISNNVQTIPQATTGNVLSENVLRRGAPLDEPYLATNAKPPKPKKTKRASKVAYKRVDQLWDQSIHNFKLTETVKDPGDAVWDQYIFTIRRKFDWEHKYVATVVDIKSKPLKECLQHIMAGVKGISLVEDKPHLDPNMLFLYLEEMREYAETLEDAADGQKRNEKKALLNKARHLRVMVKYLDKDYAETKKTLYPMLDNNLITFDLMWALYKPNTLAYCSTYGDQNEPRAFKIDYANKESHLLRGTWFNVVGRYLEYDGKAFGLGTLVTEVESFHGARKISSLECYPLQYHREAEKLTAQLIERGKDFVSLQGSNYRYHSGMAYTKRKKQVIKINIEGRVMVDPAIHRRINPNYPISTVKPKDEQDVIGGDDTDNCDDQSSSDGVANDQATPSEDTVQEEKRFRLVKMANGQHTVVEINSKEDLEVGEHGAPLTDAKQSSHEFTEEELLIASPVVLGFAFGEKLWLEFTVSGISDVVYNDQAFESLVLPDNQKSIIKALVSSHTFHAHKNIDDIISGKGRGLVAVLHGPPGTGKTLTAEGIADLLKCPLYMVSAGDLGTESTRLEKELQNILDIAHSWGAILLLDEADVFLEQRSIHDIHRNALVSIFLRLLEYFQGILFLTTNRVETFDSAFISRIHLSLRFQNLNTKAKRTVWKLFLERVMAREKMEVAPISESDYNDLARREVNGRQIKNLVRAAQALAIHEERPLSMVHIKRVIDVAESFEMDLKGGPGYSDAMRSEFYL